MKLTARQKHTSQTNPVSHDNRNRSKANSFRIIGGQWRGRKLPFPSIPGLRPTGDRIRETLFNWLAPEIPGANCLDLFAGAGALGFEALSRGAANVVLLDNNRSAIEQLKKNQDQLKCRNACIDQTNSLEWLRLKDKNQLPVFNGTLAFDIVFIDPPFQANLWHQAFNLLEDLSWLSDQAAIYVECPKGTLLSTPGNWHLHKEKHAGQLTYGLYYRFEKTMLTSNQ